MLKHELTNNGLLFQWVIQGMVKPFREWLDSGAETYYYILSPLVDNGQATCQQEACIVPFPSIYLLDEDDRCLLGVPSPYPYGLRLRGYGLLQEKGFRYELDYMDKVPDGEVLSFDRFGNVLRKGRVEYLVSTEQYALIERVERFNGLPESEKGLGVNLRQFGEIKQLALAAGCALDTALANEEVEVPAHMGVDIKEENGTISLVPTIEGAHNEAFGQAVERTRRPAQTYSVEKGDGSRVRISLTKEQADAVATIKQKGTGLSKEKVGELIQKAPALFDPEVIDFSGLYSDRVIRIGVFKPGFVPTLSKSGCNWVPGANVSAGDSGTASIKILSMKECRELEAAIATAEANGSFQVVFKGVTMDIEDAKFLLQMALRCFAKGFKGDENSDPKYKILIIEDNEKELGYSEKVDGVRCADRYPFLESGGLREGFTLKAHQREGVAWLQHLFLSKAPGCLLADDMGLGKTIQVLYLMDWHARTHHSHKSYLIVAPVSLLENWQDEYVKFFRDKRLSMVTLTNGKIPNQYDANRVAWMQQQDIILTNYESLRNGQLNFCAVDFEMVVLDEAQRIKTKGALVTHAAKALKAGFRVAMTGTPVENNLLELWCIMDFCVPGLLGDAKAFAKTYQAPLKEKDQDLKALGMRLHKQMGIYFLRRLKSDVAKELPQKVIKKVPEQMPDKQWVCYRKVLKAMEACAQQHMLAAIGDLRAISDHPYLWDKSWQQHSYEELIHDAARMVATVKILDEIRPKQEKVIVFAERKETQRLLQHLCHVRYGLDASIINGDTLAVVTNQWMGQQLSRKQTIDRFQAKEGFNVIIMSPIAAGMGLNVTAANHVIHYSRLWNPAKESQATDRAYRIGQARDVYVYYPMAVAADMDAFDQLLDKLLTRKTDLATATIFPTERLALSEGDFGQLLAKG